MDTQACLSQVDNCLAVLRPEGRGFFVASLCQQRLDDACPCPDECLYNLPKFVDLLNTESDTNTGTNKSMQEETSFGTWLRKQRRALDLSQKALADQVGCAEVTLRRIETDRLKPSQQLANVILEKIGVPDADRPEWISFARGVSGFPTATTPLSNGSITNLPAPLTTFIGREKEQADVLRLIAKYRLVTLTGAGGIGKSRMAMKVGDKSQGTIRVVCGL